MPFPSSSEYPTTTDELAVRPRGLTTHPESTITRINNANTLNATVTHQAPGMYTVKTPKNEYTVDLLNGTTTEPTAACTCPDYTYRCGEAGIDCKHIHHVKHRVINHALAPPSTNPEIWMRDYTDTLLHCLTAFTLPNDTQNHIENILLEAGETTYNIDPQVLARWTVIQTQQ